MSFTTIDAVAAHYPGFQRGISNQNPSDAQIQAWIENQAARITALALGRGFDLDTLEASNPRAYALLGLINEMGAAADLGDALYSLLGPDAPSAGWANPNSLRKSFESLLVELGRGAYDKLFVEGARTEDVYPSFAGIAGQETSPDDTGEEINAAFKKNDVF